MSGATGTVLFVPFKSVGGTLGTVQFVSLKSVGSISSGPIEESSLFFVISLAEATSTSFEAKTFKFLIVRDVV